jgi:hypothetical protein
MTSFHHVGHFKVFILVKEPALHFTFCDMAGFMMFKFICQDLFT